jgi:hypothetical protein
VISTGADPARTELASRQAEDLTAATRFYALEGVAADGFPRVGGQTVDRLVREGLIRRQAGRVPFALTLAGVDVLLEHRKASR